MISDTHSQHRQLKNMPEADILIHAGDICNYGTPEEVADFNNWIECLQYKKKIVIAGNHDKYLSSIPVQEINKTLLDNTIYLENSSIEIGGKLFWGSPITPRFMNWYFMEDRGEKIRRYWELIPDNTEVLITHGSPYGILDNILRANGDIGDSVGCFDLLQRIRQLKKLKLHCFGHIHNQYGMHRNNDGIIFVNASSANEDYEIVNQPIVIEI
jgi:Icc-related predicted phosphoesterase